MFTLPGRPPSRTSTSELYAQAQTAKRTATGRPVRGSAPRPVILGFVVSHRPTAHSPTIFSFSRGGRRAGPGWSLLLVTLAYPPFFRPGQFFSPDLDPDLGSSAQPAQDTVDNEFRSAHWALPPSEPWPQWSSSMFDALPRYPTSLSWGRVYLQKKKRTPVSAPPGNCTIWIKPVPCAPFPRAGALFPDVPSLYPGQACDRSLPTTTPGVSLFPLFLLLMVFLEVGRAFVYAQLEELLDNDVLHSHHVQSPRSGGKSHRRTEHGASSRHQLLSFGHFGLAITVCRQG